MIPASSLNQSEVNPRVVINKLSVRLYLSTFLVISFVVPLTPSLSLSTTNTMACHDPEGWSAVSRLRSFDTTPCFEEGILLSSLLGGLLVISLVRSLSLAFLESSHVSSRSTWILRAKLVIIQSSVPNILPLINKKNTGLAIWCTLRKHLQPRQDLVDSRQCSCPRVFCSRTCCNLLSHFPYLL